MEHSYSKKLSKSVAAAEVILGPDATKQLVYTLLTKMEGGKLAELGTTVKDLVVALDKYDITLKTPAVIGGRALVSVTKAEGLDTYKGYTLVDLKTSILEAAKDDLVGFLLEVVEYYWQDTLTIEDALKVSGAITVITSLTQKKDV